MGWVEERFREHMQCSVAAVDLWNNVRDSIGMAVQEFNARMSVSTSTPLSNKSCSARGKYCLRLQKEAGAFVEVFLDEQQNSLKTSGDPASESRICHYRLKPGELERVRTNSDHKAELEFFIETAGEVQVLSIEETCQAALEGFLLTPFPKMFKDLATGKTLIL